MTYFTHFLSLSLSSILNESVREHCDVLRSRRYLYTSRSPDLYQNRFGFYDLSDEMSNAKIRKRKKKGYDDLFVLASDCRVKKEKLIVEIRLFVDDFQLSYA